MDISVKDPSWRLLRWRLKLEGYVYEFVYKKGSKNINADARSRIHAAVTVPENKDDKSEVTQEEKLKIFKTNA
jgi:hypothetical protein